MNLIKRIFLIPLILVFVFNFPVSAKLRSFQSREFEGGDYRLQAYDELTYLHKDKNGKLTTFPKIQILPNGHITLPGQGEIDVLDKTVAEIKANLVIQEGEEGDLLIAYHQRHHVTVIGEVKKPGSYSVKDLMSIYDAIGAAGGFDNLANKKKVKVVRQYRNGSREQYYINFPKEIFVAFEDGIGQDKYIVKEDDIIYVPRSLLKASGKVMLSLLNVATLGLVTGAISASLTN